MKNSLEERRATAEVLLMICSLYRADLSPIGLLWDELNSKAKPRQPQKVSILWFSYLSFSILLEYLEKAWQQIDPETVVARGRYIN